MGLCFGTRRFVEKCWFTLGCITTLYYAVFGFFILIRFIFWFQIWLPFGHLVFFRRSDLLIHLWLWIGLVIRVFLNSVRLAVWLRIWQCVLELVIPVDRWLLFIDVSYRVMFLYLPCNFFYVGCELHTETAGCSWWSICDDWFFPVWVIAMRCTGFRCSLSVSLWLHDIQRWKSDVNICLNLGIVMYSSATHEVGEYAIQRRIWLFLHEVALKVTMSNMDSNPRPWCVLRGSVAYVRAPGSVLSRSLRLRTWSWLKRIISGPRSSLTL